MTNTLHRNDLPATISFGKAVAIDTETLGLNPHRDRLCLVQLSAGNGDAHLVQIDRGQTAAPRLQALLADPHVLNIFHFARFDMAVLSHRLGVMPAPIFCTKIASKLTRTFTDRHGLKDLCKDMLNIELSKQQQSSDWAAGSLTPEQLAYAASDVLYLHKLKDGLAAMLAREERTGLAESAFQFLPTRARLDLAGFAADDIFAH